LEQLAQYTHKVSVTSELAIVRGIPSDNDVQQIREALRDGFSGGLNWPIRGIDWEMRVIGKKNSWIHKPNARGREN